MKRFLPDESATQQLGAELAERSHGGEVIYLVGNLGAGKSTLVRGFLGALGHSGAVKSPTYTLIEPYEFPDRRVLHLDLYRLADPGELEYLGVRDLSTADTCLLIEWPEQGAGYLPQPDLIVRLEYRGQAREATLEARTAAGRRCLKGAD
ncbi:MAG: tRNA (adenosine(37)-N6)-threonylcarbamoyltransferase complex ATPase subunit type 1 TsaE [Gammaproteobacteria bacterium]